VILGLQALCGVLTGLLIFLVGSRMATRQSGVLACALFSVAGLAVGMARTGMPQAIAVLVVGFGYLFYQFSLAASPRKWFLISLVGLTGGIVVTMHLAMLVFYLAVPITELWRVLVCRTLSMWECLARLALFFTSAVVVVFGLEVFLNQLGSGFIECTFGYVFEKGDLGRGLQSGDFLMALKPFTNVEYPVAAVGFFWMALSEVETIFFGLAATVGIMVLGYQALKRRNPVMFLATVHLVVGLLYSCWYYATVKALYHLIYRSAYPVESSIQTFSAH